MTKEEFKTLSEKIEESNGLYYGNALREEYVKEFIKRLKEKFRYSSLFTGICISEEIDKLAGKELLK